MNVVTCSCGQVAPTGARFCPACGSALVSRRCPNGHPAIPGAAYCADCGAAIGEGEFAAHNGNGMHDGQNGTTRLEAARKVTSVHDDPDLDRDLAPARLLLAAHYQHGGPLNGHGNGVANGNGVAHGNGVTNGNGNGDRAALPTVSPESVVPLLAAPAPHPPASNEAELVAAKEMATEFSEYFRAHPAPGHVPGGEVALAELARRWNDHNALQHQLWALPPHVRMRSEAKAQEKWSSIKRLQKDVAAARMSVAQQELNVAVAGEQVHRLPELMAVVRATRNSLLNARSSVRVFSATVRD